MTTETTPKVGRRPKAAPAPGAVRSPYRYRGGFRDAYGGYSAPSGEWVPAHIQCEESEPYHVVRPTLSQWPPRSANMDDSNPSTAIQCELCGCWNVVYADNDPDRTGVLVLLPEQHKAKAVVA